MRLESKDETEEGSAQRDVALIIAAQKVEHYEIAAEGSGCIEPGERKQRTFLRN